MKRLLTYTLLFTLCMWGNSFGQIPNIIPVQSSAFLSPSLASVQATPPLRLFINLVENPQEVVQHGDRYAVLLYHQYNHSMMNLFTGIKKKRQQKALQFEAHAILFQADSLASQHEEDDVEKDFSTTKKTVFVILSIITLIAFIVILVAISRKFR